MAENTVFQELAGLVTESRNPNTNDIDIMSTEEIVRLINQEDHNVAEAISKEIPYIVQAADIMAEAFKIGGRLIYVGAGTSGRLGVLDASECPPTFGSDPEMIQGIIAGGFEALVRAQEGSEDKKEQGIADLLEKKDFLKRCCLWNSSKPENSLCYWGIGRSEKAGSKNDFYYL